MADLRKLQGQLDCLHECYS